jgi:hypothetical protein
MLNDGTRWMLTRIAMDEHRRWAERERLRRLAKEGHAQSSPGLGLIAQLRGRMRRPGRPVTGISPAPVAERQ